MPILNTVEYANRQAYFTISQITVTYIYGARHTTQMTNSNVYSTANTILCGHWTLVVSHAVMWTTSCEFSEVVFFSRCGCAGLKIIQIQDQHRTLLALGMCRYYRRTLNAIPNQWTIHKKNNNSIYWICNAITTRPYTTHDAIYAVLYWSRYCCSFQFFCVFSCSAKFTTKINHKIFL